MILAGTIILHRIINNSVSRTGSPIACRNCEDQQNAAQPLTDVHPSIQDAGDVGKSFEDSFLPVHNLKFHRLL